MRKLSIFKKLNKYIHKGFLDSDGRERGFGSAYSSEDWIRYDDYGKEKHPFLYKVLKVISNIDIWVSVRYRRYFTDIYWHVYHRFYKKSYLIDTKLPKNTWHETENMILHGVMAELVNFIEIQKDGYPWELEELDKKQRGESNSIDGEDEFSKMNDTQWMDMKEAYDIYLWWKKYPQREKEIEDILNDLKHSKHKSFMHMFADKTHKEHNSVVWSKYEEQQKLLYQEEEDMLIRVIKVRKGLTS